jgi:uncharacterized protein involved in exopolysaccharide biosynthesis
MVDANLVGALRANQAQSNAERRSAGIFEILDSPSLPQRPAGPNRLLIMALGIGTGLVLAALAATTMRLPPPGSSNIRG